MVMATLHGTTLTIRMPDGHEETFEVARLGTLKEFETVKAALASESVVRVKAVEANAGLLAQINDAGAKLADAYEAYKAEKETSADLNGKLNDDRARMTGLATALASARADSAKIAESYDDVKERFEELAKDHVARGNELDSARNGHEAAKAARQAALDANATLTAELENLMSAKSSLEETDTALEVSEKELCEAKAERDAALVAFRKLDECRVNSLMEQDASKQALADLKAELLKHAGCMSDVLDAMHEKLTGE